MSKKVLYVTTVSRTINAFLIPHIKMLIDEGYKVDIACHVDKELDEGLFRGGCRCFNIPFTRSPLSFSNLKALVELINIQKENKYDIIHTHTPIASLYGRLLKIKFRDIKTLYTAHGYHFFKGGSKLGWLIYYPIEKIMARLTDVTITINNEDYEITRRKLKPKKTYLVNGVGIDLKKYKPISSEERNRVRIELGLGLDDFVIIMIAELNKNKNHIQLIKCMEILKDKYKDIKVLLVGEGALEKSLKEEVIKNGLSGNIVFLGFRNDINELINISDLGVSLSFREGLPKNIMELMACGKPVICSNIRGSKDLIKDKYNGYLVGINDYIGLKNKIISLYESKYNLDIFSRNSIKEIEKYNIINLLYSLKYIYNTFDSNDNQSKFIWK